MDLHRRCFSSPWWMLCIRGVYFFFYRITTRSNKAYRLSHSPANTQESWPSNQSMKKLVILVFRQLLPLSWSPSMASWVLSYTTKQHFGFCGRLGFYHIYSQTHHFSQFPALSCHPNQCQGLGRLPSGEEGQWGQQTETSCLALIGNSSLRVGERR